MYRFSPKRRRAKNSRRRWEPVAAWSAVLLLLLLIPNEAIAYFGYIGPTTSLLGHILGFGVLGFLTYRAFHLDENLWWSAVDNLTVSLVLLALASIATELLQTFSIGRIFAWDDVVANWSASFAGSFIAAVIYSE